METIPEEKSVLENVLIKNQTLNNEEIEKHVLNSVYESCNFNNVIFKTLSRTKFVKCNFSDCVFHQNIKNCTFSNCIHKKSNFTKILLKDCVFTKTALHETVLMFSKFDNCCFKDGELSSNSTQQSVFLQNKFHRYNFLPQTKIENATFSDSSFESLSIRFVTVLDTVFKNCLFKRVNQSSSSYSRCSLSH